MALKSDELKPTVSMPADFRHSSKPSWVQRPPIQGCEWGCPIPTDGKFSLGDFRQPKVRYSLLYPQSNAPTLGYTAKRTFSVILESFIQLNMSLEHNWDEVIRGWRIC